jgi:hypothetical protein
MRTGNCCCRRHRPYSCPSNRSSSRRTTSPK